MTQPIATSATAISAPLALVELPPELVWLPSVLLIAPETEAVVLATMAELAELAEMLCVCVPVALADMSPPVRLAMPKPVSPAEGAVLVVTATAGVAEADATLALLDVRMPNSVEGAITSDKNLRLVLSHSGESG